MKQLIFQISFCVLFAFSCSDSPSPIDIDCDALENVYAFSNISETYSYYYPNIIITNDPFYSNLGLENYSSDEELKPLSVKFEIFDKNANVLVVKDSLEYILNTSTILMWDGKIGSQEQTGIFKIRSSIIFENGKYLNFESFFISTNCEELELCYQAQENCNLINCRYYNQQNQNPDFPIRICP